MPSTKEILISARALIEKPENWTQGHYEVTRPCGNAYCMAGAVMALHFDYEPKMAARRALMASIGDVTTHFNDTHTHAEVLAAFDKAIAEAA